MFSLVCELFTRLLGLAVTVICCFGWLLFVVDFASFWLNAGWSCWYWF